MWVNHLVTEQGFLFRHYLVLNDGWSSNQVTYREFVLLLYCYFWSLLTFYNG